MNKLIKKYKSTVILISTICIVIILTWPLYAIAKNIFPLDFSQEYRNIQDVDHIVLERNGWGQYYKRCFWGLKETKDFQVDNPNNVCESDASIDALLNLIDTNNKIRQSIYSPNKEYILYCEIQYQYKNTGLTDDEYCYYKVYELKSGIIITIYQGYREWYNLYWLE